MTPTRTAQREALADLQGYLNELRIKRDRLAAEGEHTQALNVNDSIRRVKEIEGDAS